MAMVTARRGVLSDVNVTPMIDVLLVLLVIFMVVQQGLQKGLSVQIPPPDPAAPTSDHPAIVLEVEPGGGLYLNRQAVDAAELEATLTRVYAGRPEKILFVKGAESVSYGEVAGAVDAGRAAGVQVVGLVPRPAPGP
ncbi:MAG TPA: biopolymer transporter ExbD [Longimicrobiaceae bacterium]|nr:biopolymer transporter ExbD [Longimicrobiaceae bacterium]